ncbi:MAG: tyrosine-type recombinase/integrase [Gammaproteobacteria bacterium]|nr:tyrosine-type recombinase/integrase [Gammaproteobacteria bacterium]
MKLTAAAAEFLQSLDAEGRSPHTTAAYRRDLAVFAEFAGDITLDDVTPALLQQFMAHQSVQFAPSGAPRAKASVNRYRVTVKALFAWAAARWLVKRNPTSILRCQRHRGLPPAVLDASEIARLLEFPFVGSTAQRDHSLIAFMLLTGCRLAETCALDASDIDLVTHVAVLRTTKGGDPDRVMLSPTLAAILAAHIARCTDQRGPLFAAHARRLSTRQVQRIVVQRVAEAGINKPITAHSLRHSFACALYNNCMDIRLVQQALRHQHVSTTEVYAHVDPLRWRREIAALS